MIGRRVAVQRLMRPLAVVDARELIKALLLLGDVARWRRGGFGFQCPVHPLVPPILLRLARLNPLRDNAQFHPPHAQPAQASDAGGCKRRPVVAAHPLRQPVAPEHLRQLTSDRPRVAHRHGLAAQQIARRRIAHRQRIAAPPIAASKPPLEVDRPDLIRLDGVCQRLRRRRRPPPLLPPAAQTVAVQNQPQRAFGRPGKLRHLPLQPRPQLARTPTRMRVPQIDHPLLQRLRRPSRLHQRPPGAILQPLQTAQLIALQPLICCLPADREAPGQLGDTLAALLPALHQPKPLFHHIAHFPGHRLAACPKSVTDVLRNFCYLCGRFVPCAPRTETSVPGFLARQPAAPTLHWRTVEERVSTKSYDRRLLGRLLALSLPWWRPVVVATLCLLLGSFLQVVTPLLTGIAIDRYIVPAGQPISFRLEHYLAAGRAAGLAEIALLYLLALVVGFGADFIQQFLMQRTGQHAMFELRRRVMAHLQALDIAFYDRNPVGRLVTRVTTDADALNELFTSGLVTVFGDILVLVFIFGAMFRLSLGLT